MQMDVVAIVLSLLFVELLSHFKVFESVTDSCRQAGSILSEFLGLR